MQDLKLEKEKPNKPMRQKRYTYLFIRILSGTSKFYKIVKVSICELNLRKIAIEMQYFSLTLIL